MNKLSLKLQKEAKNKNTSTERLAELANMNDSLACLVAKNVNTSPDTLTQLAKSKITAIRKIVVKNPNTPTKILIKLGK